MSYTDREENQLKPINEYVKDDGTIRYRDLKKLWRVRDHMSKEELLRLARYTDRTAREYSQRIDRMRKQKRRLWEESGRTEKVWALKSPESGKK